MTRIEKIIKIINKFGYMRGTSYQMKCELLKHNKIINSKWTDSFRAKYEDNDPTIEDAIAFADCIDFKFFVRKQKLLCIVNIHERRFVTGEYDGERCKFTVEVGKITDTMMDWFNMTIKEIAKFELEAEDALAYKKRLVLKIKEIEK